ncbi:hypothetical protein FXF53_10925 [Micromonospora sp. WP24]|nr:hypothetical protein FXF53_10925 [Micromonospora sp. WP24]
MGRERGARPGRPIPLRRTGADAESSPGT